MQPIDNSNRDLMADRRMVSWVLPAKDQPMLDLVYAGLGIGSFLLLVAYAVVCSRL